MSKLIKPIESEVLYFVFKGEAPNKEVIIDVKAVRQLEQEHQDFLNKDLIFKARLDNMVESARITAEEIGECYCCVETIQQVIDVFNQLKAKEK